MEQSCGGENLVASYGTWSDVVDAISAPIGLIFVSLSCGTIVAPFVLVGWLIRSERRFVAKIGIAIVVILLDIALGSVVLPFWSEPN